jgi:hypothetical protein
MNVRYDPITIHPSACGKLLVDETALFTPVDQQQNNKKSDRRKEFDDNHFWLTLM